MSTPGAPENFWTLVLSNAAGFLQFGPLGFAALIFICVIFALVIGANDTARHKTLRQVIYISFACFCVSAVLAFVPPFIESSKPVLTAVQAQQIVDAASQNEQAKAAVGTMFFNVQNSCGGGSGGQNPGNFSTQRALSVTASASLDAVSRALQTALICTRPR